MGILYENRVNELHIWRRNTLSYLPHFHDSIEIVYMLKGKARAIIGGKEYPLSPHCLCITMPNDIHAYDNEENVDAYFMIVPRRFLDAFTSLLDINTVNTPLVVCEDTVLLHIIETIISVNKKPHPYHKQVLQGHFSILFGEIFARTGLTESRKSPTETERRIITYCLENFTSDISLEQLESALNISKNHISFIFSTKLKVRLPDFLGSLRVVEAKRLIENGASMTEAALNAGFASIRTFNRRFLAETGMTPREYARQHMTNSKVP